MKKWDSLDVDFDFLKEKEQVKEKIYGSYKILVVDDDDEIHKVTNIVLNDFDFENKSIEIIDAYSGAEAKEIMRNNDDIAVLFLDVVMETNHSGLDVIRYIREELENEEVRIILRTGQPGEAPESRVIREYDINDYHIKTEFTDRRLFTSLYSALRSYRDIQKIKMHKKGLEKIIKASATLFEKNALDTFLTSILEQFSTFKTDHNDLVYVHSQKKLESNGFVTICGNDGGKIMAATGRFNRYIGKDVTEINDMNEITDYMSTLNGITPDSIVQLTKGFLIFTPGNKSLKSWIYIEGDREQFDFDLISIFMSNFTIALDNYMMNSYIIEAQKDIVYTMANTVESHFTDTGFHVKRISAMMYNFSIILGYSHEEAETYKFASAMHDLGKIVIPDSILKKPGKLTKEEFEIMKTHTTHGHLILKDSKLPILKIASEISLRHHEWYNGKGYPNGISGEEIPIHARMMALVDVFDAMSHKRIYKDAISYDVCLDWIRDNRGTQFDPILTDSFIKNIDAIIDFSDESLDGLI